MAITTPDAVPGEVIEAAWGDAVRADLTALDTGKMKRGGDTTTGGYVTSDGSWQAGGNPATPATGTRMWPVGTFQSYTSDTSFNVALRRGGAAGVGEKFVSMARLSAGAEIGSISIATTGAVAYNTTSDPRLKTSPPATRGIGDAAERVRQFGGAAWEGQWIDTETGEAAGETWDLLSSHDVEDVAPYAVTGERDAVDGDGNPVYQQVNYPALVPLLFAALSDALERIEALEAAAA